MPGLLLQQHGLVGLSQLALCSAVSLGSVCILLPLHCCLTSLHSLAELSIANNPCQCIASYASCMDIAIIANGVLGLQPIVSGYSGHDV